MQPYNHLLTYSTFYRAASCFFFSYRKISHLSCFFWCSSYAKRSANCFCSFCLPILFLPFYLQLSRLGSAFASLALFCCEGLMVSLCFILGSLWVCFLVVSGLVFSMGVLVVTELLSGGERFLGLCVDMLLADFWLIFLMSVPPSYFSQMDVLGHKKSYNFYFIRRLISLFILVFSVKLGSYRMARLKSLRWSFTALLEKQQEVQGSLRASYILAFSLRLYLLLKCSSRVLLRISGQRLLICLSLLRRSTDYMPIEIKYIITQPTPLYHPLIHQQYALPTQNSHSPDHRPTAPPLPRLTPPPHSPTAPALHQSPTPHHLVPAEDISVCGLQGGFGPYHRNIEIMRILQLLPLDIQRLQPSGSEASNPRPGNLQRFLRCLLAQ